MICSLLPSGVEELALPEFLADTCLDSCLLKFRHLNSLTFSFPFNINNPELLLEFKELKHLDLSSFYPVKWSPVHSDNNKTIKCLSHFQNCERFIYFYPSDISDRVLHKKIEGFAPVLEKLNLASLFIDGEYLFVLPDTTIEKLSEISEIRIINSIPEYYIANGELHDELIRKLAFIKKTLPHGKIHSYEFKFLP